MNNYKRGLITGIPIALGYLSVSFTFGIMAVSFGLSWWQAVLISMTTVTSAGQFAGIGIMIHPGQYIQMLISQITINIRYSFMSISIGQKADSRFSGIYRWLLGFFITDEIFAVATKEDEIKRSYFAGLATLPYWAGHMHIYWCYSWKYSSRPPYECFKCCNLWNVRCRGCSRDEESSPRPDCRNHCNYT